MHCKMIALLLSALSAASFSFTALAGNDNEASLKAQKVLQGKWLSAKGEKYQMDFDGNKFTLEFKGESASGTYTTDTSKKPHTMDLLVVKGTGDFTKKFEGKTSRAIYAVEGTTLKWLANEPGKEDCPEAFPAEGKTKHLYVIFERAEK